MLKLTSLDGSPIFVRSQEIHAVSPGDEEGTTFVYMSSDTIFEVTEDAEKITRYLCEKANYSGNDQYDTLETRVIERDEDAFDTVDVSLSYAAKYLEKKIEEKEGEYLNQYHQITLDNIKRLQRTLASVTVREVE